MFNARLFLWVFLYNLFVTSKGFLSILPQMVMFDILSQTQNGFLSSFHSSNSMNLLKDKDFWTSTRDQSSMCVRNKFKFSIPFRCERFYVDVHLEPKYAQFKKLNTRIVDQ